MVEPPTNDQAPIAGRERCTRCHQSRKLSMAEIQAIAKGCRFPNRSTDSSRITSSQADTNTQNQGYCVKYIYHKALSTALIGTLRGAGLAQ